MALEVSTRLRLSQLRGDHRQKSLFGLPLFKQHNSMPRCSSLFTDSIIIGRLLIDIH
jgi:hypothetical protein